VTSQRYVTCSAKGGHFSKGLAGYNIGNVRQFFKKKYVGSDHSLVSSLQRQHVELHNLKVFLALAVELCCVGFIYPILKVTQVSGDRD
jgi:hypothetical protein